MIEVCRGRTMTGQEKRDQGMYRNITGDECPCCGGGELSIVDGVCLMCESVSPLPGSTQHLVRGFNASVQALLGAIIRWKPSEPFMDDRLEFWPVGTSRFVFWALRAMGQDVYGECSHIDGHPSAWVWNTGEATVTFARDWDEDMDSPIILKFEPYEDDWIPVDRRLPELTDGMSEDVLAWSIMGPRVVFYDCTGDTPSWGLSATGGGHHVPITHWKPLKAPAGTENAREHQPPSK